MRVVLSMKLFGGVSPTAGFDISMGDLGEGEISLDGDGLLEREWVLSPGRHSIRIAYRGTAPIPTDDGPRWFRVEGLRARLATDPLALDR